MTREDEAVGSVLSSPEEIVDLRAVVIGYDGGRGILLVNHRNSPSLEATVDSYVRNPRARNHWFASFKWALVNKADRAEIESLYKALAGKPRAKDKKAKGLGRVLVGMTGACPEFCGSRRLVV